MGSAWGLRRFWGLALIVSAAMAAGCGEATGDDASSVADEVGGQHGPGAAGESGHDTGSLPRQPACNEMDSPGPDQFCGLTWEEHHQINTRHVRGTAFGIGIDGGCIYGSVHEGEIRVEIDGWIRDGGCLGSYGH